MTQTLNALIYPSAPTVIVERRMIDVSTIPEQKASWWRPVEVVGDDSFDPLTQKKTGPVTTIEPTRVVDTFTIVNLTAQEISDRKDSQVDGLRNADLLKVILNLHNRIRVLEGQSTHTMAQLKNALKALL